MKAKPSYQGGLTFLEMLLLPKKSSIFIVEFDTYCYLIVLEWSKSGRFASSCKSVPHLKLQWVCNGWKILRFSANRFAVAWYEIWSLKWFISGIFTQPKIEFIFQCIYPCVFNLPFLQLTHYILYIYMYIYIYSVVKIKRPNFYYFCTWEPLTYIEI